MVAAAICMIIGFLLGIGGMCLGAVLVKYVDRDEKPNGANPARAAAPASAMTGWKAVYKTKKEHEAEEPEALTCAQTGEGTCPDPED